LQPIEKKKQEQNFLDSYSWVHFMHTCEYHMKVISHA